MLFPFFSRAMTYFNIYFLSFKSLLFCLVNIYHLIHLSKRVLQKNLISQPVPKFRTTPIWYAVILIVLLSQIYVCNSSELEEAQNNVQSHSVKYRFQNQMDKSIKITTKIKIRNRVINEKQQGNLDLLLQIFIWHIRKIKCHNAHSLTMGKKLDTLIVLASWVLLLQVRDHMKIV